MSAAPELPTLAFATPAEFARWMEAEHERAPGLWLKIAKKGTGAASITYAEALDVALAHGWIDGQRAKHDDAYWLQRFTPRRARSPWSKINRGKAEALIAAGRMTPAGLREVERAREDGRWEAAYAGQGTATVPDDLARELAARPEARAFFAGLDSTNRYAILYRLGTAKKPETRARRLAQFVAMLEAGETLHPRRRTTSS